jgi:hypothetical protein
MTEGSTAGWKPDVVLYHGNCQDGFTAAWCVYRSLGMDPDYRPVYHGQSPRVEDFMDKDVLFVDFTYKAPMMKAIGAVARSIVVLDHHASAEMDLAEFDSFDVGDPNSFARALDSAQSEKQETEVPIILTGFDMKRSGAMLAWDFFNPGIEAPFLVSIVQDRDLWKFELSGSKAISMWLFSFDYSFGVWDAASAQLDTTQGRLEARHAGEAIERKHMKDIRELLQQTQFVATIGGYQVSCANMPYTMASDAAGLMAQQDPDQFAATFHLDSNGVAKFSLRSVKGSGMDVSKIAARFGGGGHPNASGFEYKTEFYPIKL